MSGVSEITEISESPFVNTPEQRTSDPAPKWPKLFGTQKYSTYGTLKESPSCPQAPTRDPYRDVGWEFSAEIKKIAFYQNFPL